MWGLRWQASYQKKELASEAYAATAPTATGMAGWLVDWPPRGIPAPAGPGMRSWTVRAFVQVMNVMVLLLAVKVAVKVYDGACGLFLGAVGNARPQRSELGELRVDQATGSAVRWVGHRIDVWWEGSEEWQSADVLRFDASVGRHVIQYRGGKYTDGLVERLDLTSGAERVRLHFGPEWVGRAVEVAAVEVSAAEAAAPLGTTAIIGPGWVRINITRYHPHNGSYSALMFTSPAGAEVTVGRPVQVDLRQLFIRLSQPLPPPSPAPARHSFVGVMPPEAWLGRAVEVYDQDRRKWRRGRVELDGYDRGTGKHWVHFGSKVAPELVVLTVGIARLLYDLEVGARLKVFYPEYHKWYPAEVVAAFSNGSHRVKYTGLGLTYPSIIETLVLGDERVRLIPGPELVGKGVRIFNEKRGSWSRWLVARYNPDRETYTLKNTRGAKSEKDLGAMTYIVEQAEL